MGGVCTLVVRFLKEWRQLAARFWIVNDVWTHIGVDVQRHAGSPRVCSLAYDLHIEVQRHNQPQLLAELEALSAAIDEDRR